jgi:Fe-S-cluster containining protein
MGNASKRKSDVSGRAASVPAGEFSEWLRGTEASLRSGNGGSDVPCGACRGCCRSSMFIHITPEETQTLQRIPGALLFPAPGLPKGHVLMGYGDKGQCPMLVDNRCSIYEHRPRTCRDYDCRVFAATGVSVDERTQAEIARRVEAWAFDYGSQESHEEHRMLREAAAFLQKNRDLFPLGSLPSYPVQLAALAVRIYRVFCDMRVRGGGDVCGGRDAVIARSILSSISER